MYNKYKKNRHEFFKATLYRRPIEAGFIPSRFLLNDFKEQDKQYKALTAKITFLFGFSVSVLTLYGTYAEDVNAVCKWVAFVLFTITLGLLCFAYCNRTFKKPDRLDTSVDKSNYFSKIYQEVSNIEKICIENDAPLKEMALFVRWSIISFTLGMVALAASFVLWYIHV